MTPRNFIVDGNSILYRYFYPNKKEDIDTIKSLAFIGLLQRIRFLHERFKCNNTVLVFDSPGDSWRSVYTSDNNPNKITHRKYKDGRRKNLTPSEKAKLDEFSANIDEIVNFFRTYTTVVCLQKKYLEADDLIAGYVQIFNNHEHVIYSSDKDFLQLISGDHIKLVEPSEDSERTLDEWNGDPKLFLFEKCFRGEPYASDNVQNAYPRLRRDKILKSYEDDYLLNNLMSHEFKVEDIDSNGELKTYEYVTRDIFKENMYLMSLRAQPKSVKELIYDSIMKARENRPEYNHRGILVYMKDNGMIEAIQNMANMVHSLHNKELNQGSFLSLSEFVELGD